MTRGSRGTLTADLLLLGLLGSGRFESGLPTAESILPRGLFRMVTAERADECPFEHLGAC